MRFKITMPTEQPQEIDTNTLDEMEELRRKTNIRFFICLGIFVVFSIFIVTVFAGIRYNWVPLLIAAIIFAVIGVRPYNKARNQYRLQYKEIFIENMLKNIFNNLIYHPDQGIPKEVIANTKMMHMGDIYSSNDYIEADYNGVHFTQSDVYIAEETEDSDGDSHTYTLFLGRWMIFNFNKEFKANVQVVQKGFRNSKRKRFFGKKEELYKKVEMEDVSFNEDFKVFAQDPHDAFYLLTPAMMDKIRNLCNSVDGKLIFCFIGDNLHIGIHNGKDSFEPSFGKLDPEVETANTVMGIDVITKFITELKLDNNLFKENI